MSSLELSANDKHLSTLNVLQLLLDYDPQLNTLWLNVQTVLKFHSALGESQKLYLPK